MKKAIIIGAGPAGLTAAYELLKRTDIVPIILEKSEYIGGISRTIDFKGNRMDMGPHRFFSKSDRVMDWWLDIMPLDENQKDATISYQNKSRTIHENDSHQKKEPLDGGKRMLIIPRLTRIYFLRNFFAYPIQLSIDTLKTLGLVRTVKILLSFLWVKMFPTKPEKNLEDFIINKFGRQLYLLFFKDYTEKVWGKACNEISAEWGAQRIKGVSLSKAIQTAVKNLSKKSVQDISQKGTETSLIEQFLYPKYGPGSLWEEVARQVQEMGGMIYLNQNVQQIYTTDNEVCSVHSINSKTGELFLFEGDYFFSTMPVQELIAGMSGYVPAEVKQAAAGLEYRDFINVGILLKELSSIEGDSKKKLDLKDNWIYIQERDVKVGRLMIYNNWGGGMVKDPNTVWIGMEYFCNKTDDFWALDDETIKQLAIEELIKMDLAQMEDVLDTTVARMEKTYPAYFGTYNDFDKIRTYTDKLENLFLIGRNGMHKYNNADHSMLTAMVSVDNIAAGIQSKENIWSINTEQEYHEEKTEPATAPANSQTAPGILGRIYQPSTLLHYAFAKRENSIFLIMALAFFIIQFIVFKIKYPFANYMPDSYSYIQAAYSNSDVNTWPVAYSKFIRLVSVFTHSDKILVGMQYFYMQISSLVFLLSLTLFAKPGILVRNILWIFFVFNPVNLYVANYISADALFIGSSYLWMASLLWIMYRPFKSSLILQGLLILVCFTLRYNAIYYPFITTLAFVLSKKNWTYKMVGLGFTCVLILSSIIYTTKKMAEVTGKEQFSAFGGWQLANNALYMYQTIPKQQRKPVPAEFAKIESAVLAHFDTVRRVKFTKEDTLNSYFYLWSSRGPLVQYMNKVYANDTVTPYFNRWSSVAPLYKKYALFLIKRYPIAYAHAFMFPNAIKFAVPPTEFLGQYNMGGDSVGQLAKVWFQYKSQKVGTHKKDADGIPMVDWFPVFTSLVNLLMVINFIGLLFFKHKPSTIIYLILGFWLANMAFSIFASPIVLRYQLLPTMLVFAMALLLGEQIYGAKNETVQQTPAMELN